MFSKMSQSERIDIDKQISDLLNDKSLSEGEVKAICEKVYPLINIFKK
jgi:hypothetical protein